MSKSQGKWWLVIVVVCCLVPGAFAKRDQGCNARDRGRNEHCQQVPEGGSAAVYLLGAGLTCFGAMFLRSRAAKPERS